MSTLSKQIPRSFFRPYWMTSDHESVLLHMLQTCGTPHRTEDFDVRNAQELLSELWKRGFISPRWGDWSFTGMGLRYVTRWMVDREE